MSKDAAKAYQASIDALGVSVNDLYLSPELMDKYLELNRQARDMAVPSEEYNKQMRSVRDITFQFQRLKIEGTYALQWIGYYLTKYLSGPLGDARDWLTKINDKIQETMPQWTKKVAEVASWLVRLGKAAWYIRDAIGAAAAVFTAFSLIKMASNPFGAFILGLTALLLLVDDYRAWENDKSGKSSVFNDLWTWVDKFAEKMKNSGFTMENFQKGLSKVVKWVKKLKAWFEKIGQSEEFKALVKSLESIFSNLVIIIRETAGWFEELGKKLKENGDLDKFKTDVNKLALSILGLVEAITSLMLKLGKGGLGDSIQHNLINMLEIVDGLVKSITGGIEIITGFINGDKKKAKEGVEDVVGGVSDAVVGPKNTEKAKNWIQGIDDAIAKSDFWSKFLGSLGWRNGAEVDSSSQSPKAGQTSYEAPTVDLTAIKKGFADLGSSISQTQNHYLTDNTQNQTTNNSHFYPESPTPAAAPTPQWSSFKNSIPGANTEATTVDWSALKKGFVAFMNSIPKEFGDISKGLFQVAKGYGDSGSLVGAGGTMSYLYPQTNTSNMSQLSMKQTYNIYGASNPEAVATTVNRTSTSSLTRHFQGGVR
jgi:hypothetical protein